MKNSFKFLTIGLVLAVLLVSYATTNKTVSAAPITSLDQDLVEWLDDSREVVTFYNASTTATFIISDNDLETKPDAIATWIGVPTVAIADSFAITDGDIDDDSGGGGFLATRATYTLTANPTTATLEYSTSSPSTTPIVTGTLAVTVAGVSTLVDSSNLNAGTFSLIAEAATGTTVIANFDHHVIDSYAAAATGATVGSTNNRVKVVSTSDSSGEWVTISEIATPFGNSTALASLAADPDDKIFRGAVTLSDDPQATDPDDGKIWVQDGDTLTVTFYRSDHVTVIDSTTATIDATDPAITAISPADGSVIKDVSPNLSFTITDGGSGLSTSAPEGNVEVKIVTTAGDCNIEDNDGGSSTSELSYPSRSASSLSVSFAPVGTDKEWADPVTGSCASRTGGGFGIDTTTLGVNNHGVAFTWKIVATDVAGNSKTLETTSLDLTVDTVKPDMTAAVTGKGWDSALNTDKTQLNSVKLTFTEGLDVDTVATDGSDFTVAGHSVVAALVAGVDNTSTGGTNDLNEFVYLELAADVSSNDRPKVELTGAIKDKAGNELKPATGATVADSIPNSTDGVKATISDVIVASTLLAKKGESKLTWTANENITFGSPNLSSATDETACTCISVSGGGTTTNKTGVVTTVSASAAEGTFKQTTFTTTGIYGAIILSRDLAANQTVTGAVKVSSEDVSSQFDSSSDSLVLTLDTNTVSPLDAGKDVAVKLAKWPIADNDGDGSLTDEFTVTVNGTAVGTTTVTAIDWSEAETVTMSFSTAIAAGDTVTVTYRYVTGAQAIEVDTAAPGISFDPADGTTTEDATPFVSIIFDDDEYAGDTHKTVTLTLATLTDPDGVVTDLMAMDDIGDGFGALATADNITYIYTPTSDLALGVYTVKASGTDEAGNTKSNVAGVFTVKARATTKITLRPGWNLISLPSDPTSTAINDVVNVASVDTVLAYDPTVAGGWMTAVRDTDGNLTGTLTTMDSSRGYWVHTTTFESLAIEIPGIAGGAQTLPPSIALVKGWNLVSVISLDKSVTAIDPDQYFTGLTWSRAYSFSAATEKFAGIIPQASTATDDATIQDRVTVGNGYWVFLREAGDLVP